MRLPLNLSAVQAGLPPRVSAGPAPGAGMSPITCSMLYRLDLHGSPSKCDRQSPPPLLGRSEKIICLPDLPT